MFSTVSIAGANVGRSTLIEAARKTPQEPEWVVMDGHLQPATFLQQLDHYRGDTIEQVADSAQSHIASLEQHRSRNAKIGWAGLGIAVAGALTAALSPAPMVGVGLIVGGLMTADFGRIGVSWDRDEMASTQHFIGELGEWGAILSNSQPQPPAQPMHAPPR
jgi:hypothetical protein